MKSLRKLLLFLLVVLSISGVDGKPTTGLGQENINSSNNGGNNSNIQILQNPKVPPGEVNWRDEVREEFYPFSCTQVIEFYTFEGTCCSLIDINGGSACGLRVTDGWCHLGGPNTIPITYGSTNKAKCPKSPQYDPILNLDGDGEPVTITKAPTTSPSETPSESPSTSAPTLSPTTGEPSSIPSATPTVSAAPSPTPTAAPSTSPSASPTDAPSTFPSDTPSMMPSTTPSVVPSTMPSTTPSSSPTVFNAILDDTLSVDNATTTASFDAVQVRTASVSSMIAVTSYDFAHVSPEEDLTVSFRVPQKVVEHYNTTSNHAARLCLHRKIAIANINKDEDDVRTYHVCALQHPKLGGDDSRQQSMQMPSACVGGVFLYGEQRNVSQKDKLCVDVSSLLDAVVATHTNSNSSAIIDPGNDAVTPSKLRQRQRRQLQPQQQVVMQRISFMIQTSNEQQGQDVFWEDGRPLGPKLYIDGMEDILPPTAAPTEAPTSVDVTEKNGKNDGEKEQELEVVILTPPPDNEGTEAPIVENSSGAAQYGWWDMSALLGFAVAAIFL